jgi:hypothetical protein
MKLWEDICRVVDPDPHRINRVSGSRSRRAKITTKIEKSKEFSCFEELDVLFRGLKASPVALASFREAKE